MKNEAPLIHFIGPNATKSPCGDDDDEAVLTENIKDVTCQMCLFELRNKMIGPKRTLH